MKINNRYEMIGSTFGRLTVVKESDPPQHVKEKRDYWKCVCSCEDKKTTIVMGKNLRMGMTQSCGCLQKEKLLEKCKKYNKFDLSNNYGIGHDSKNNIFYFDLEDYEKIKNYYWRKSKWGYFYYSMLGEHVFMHNFVLNNEDNKDKKIIIDHINRVRHDNRKNNLRTSTVQQNSWNKTIPSNNTSGVIGVSFDNKSKVWEAYLEKNGKRIVREKFTNLKEAIICRLNAEKKHYGEFSPQKHLFKKYGIENG